MTSASRVEPSGYSPPSAVGLEPGRLSPSELENLSQSFYENGYVVIKNVVSKERLSSLHATVSEEFERAKLGELFAGGGRISGHLNCFPGDSARFAYDALQARGVIDLMTSLIGRPLGPMRVGCNLNLPKSVAQHYHVDSSFLDAFLIANVAVVDTDLINGAIDVVPGTQKRFYKYWRFAVERQHRHHARVPMNKGDVLVRTSTLWHRGMPNRSNAPRPMLAFTFGEKTGPAPTGDPFQFNDGKVKFLPNWYRPTLVGRARERIFVAAPVTYAAYRFVRSLYGTKGYDTQ